MKKTDFFYTWGKMCIFLYFVGKFQLLLLLLTMMEIINE